MAIMNAPFVVAQATGTAASGNPVQTIKLYKPKAGETVVFKASFTGQVKIIFSDIANEKITLFKDNAKQSLHIIFADGSQAIIEPFFDSVTISSLAHAAKPAPQIFEVALEKHAADPEEAVHIGDSLRDDVEGAQKAGLTGILLDRKGEVQGASVPVIRTLDELLPLVACSQ